jgi:hypothetical protein
MLHAEAAEAEAYTIQSEEHVIELRSPVAEDNTKCAENYFSFKPRLICIR